MAARFPTLAVAVALAAAPVAAHAGTYNVWSWPSLNPACKNVPAVSQWAAWAKCMAQYGISETPQTSVIATAPSCKSMWYIVPQDGSRAFRWAYDVRFAAKC